MSVRCCEERSAWHSGRFRGEGPRYNRAGPSHPIMVNCPECGVVNEDELERCSACSSDFGNLKLTLARDSASGLTEHDRPATLDSGSRRKRVFGFADGQNLSSRYRIVRLLGEGGMGEVYLAHDADLDRDVALKIIRNDMSDYPSILDRFKREVQLSSKVTHKNVLRVYDLGEAGNVKFLTMQFIEGQDLESMMRQQGRLPMPTIVEVFRQVCEGLAAAHEQGVIHRDLKPQNIMVDKSGRVVVTDFGLAKSLEHAGLTEAGKILGTPHYMSPEQVKGVVLDERSDIFSLGVILYEMLTGTMPFTGGSAYEIMISRVTRPARPASDLNNAIPQYLLRVLQRCLETNLDLRYRSVSEILRDLGQQTFHSTLGYEVRRRPRFLRWASSVAIALVVIASLAFGWRRLRESAAHASDAAHKPVSVLVADLENRTGDPVFDGTLEPVLTLALEGAAFVNSYSRTQAHKTAAQIQAGTTGLDERMARLVAAREGLSVVISGSVSHDGDGYTLALKALDGITGKPIESTEVKAESKEKMLAAVGRAAADLRNALGDTTPTSAQLAAAETFTAGSLEAAHEYAVAQDLQFAGKFDEAIRHYEQAIKRDPDLGRAYSGLAAVYANIGRQSDGEKQYRLAMSHIDRMSEREKYRTRAAYYLVVHNLSRAIEELNQLVKEFPSDEAGLNNLALLYFYQRDMEHALEASQRPISLYPKNAIGRNNAALYAMYAGQFAAAVKQAQTVLQLNPAYHKAYVAIGLSQLGMNDVPGAVATYQKLGTLNARAQSLAAAGLADIALYEGRAKEAVQLLRESATHDLADQRKDAAARKLATAAEATADEKLAEESIAASPRDAHTLFQAARALLAAGNEKRALAIASQLKTELTPELQQYGKLIEGEALLRRGDAREAINRFEDAKRLSDSWIMHFDRGRAYLALNAFTEANADFESCSNRAGEATAVFLDDVPTFHVFPPVYYYLGRAREGLGSSSAAGSYRQFINIKAKGDGDPLVADARRRLLSSAASTAPAK